MDVETDAASRLAILEGRLKLCNEASQAVRDEMRKESAGAGVCNDTELQICRFNLRFIWPLNEY